MLHKSTSRFTLIEKNESDGKQCHGGGGGKVKLDKRRFRRERRCRLEDGLQTGWKMILSNSQVSPLPGCVHSHKWDVTQQRPWQFKVWLILVLIAQKPGSCFISSCGKGSSRHVGNSWMEVECNTPPSTSTLSSLCWLFLLLRHWWLLGLIFPPKLMLRLMLKQEPWLLSALARRAHQQECKECLFKNSSNQRWLLVKHRWSNTPAHSSDFS